MVSFSPILKIFENIDSAYAISKILKFENFFDRKMVIENVDEVKISRIKTGGYMYQKEEVNI